MPKLSVVTINFNDLSGLKKTLSSVFSQSGFFDVELIVIDGGSSDGSRDFLVENESRIFRWVSEKDRGIFNAQNKGWKMATGEYVLFLNAGDHFADDDVVAAFFACERKADIIYGNMQIGEGTGSRIGHMPDRIGYVQLYRDTLWHPVSFIRRELLEKLNGFDERFRVVADYDFFCKAILQNKSSLIHIDKVISVFDTGGLSSSPDQVQRIQRERLEVQKKYFPRILLWIFRLYSKLRA